MAQRVFYSRLRTRKRRAQGAGESAGEPRRTRGERSGGGSAPTGAAAPRAAAREGRRRAEATPPKIARGSGRKKGGVHFQPGLVFFIIDKGRVFFWLKVHAISYRRQNLLKNNSGAAVGAQRSAPPAPPGQGDWGARAPGKPPKGQQPKNANKPHAKRNKEGEPTRREEERKKQRI